VATEAAIVSPHMIPLPAPTGRSLGASSVTSTAQAGIREFLDSGTGIPTAGGTHQIAQAHHSETQAVYVDNDRCTSGRAHAFGADQVI
jgi:hypothetical protein